MSRTRILYWFRTPPGVTVGRSALDESAIRSLEDNNPDVEFDWTRILKEHSGPEPAGAAPRPAGPERQGLRRTTEPRTGRGPAPPVPRRAPAAAPPPDPPAVPAGSSAPAAPAAPADPVEGDPVAMPLTPAHARFGAEGVLRLRARHAEILARISERVEDPVRRDELKSQAERLNPDTWVTDDDVRVGIDEYEGVLSALRAIVGQGRRRPRGGSASSPGNAEAAAAGEPQSVPGKVLDADPDQRAAGSAQPDEEPV